MMGASEPPFWGAFGRQLSFDKTITNQNVHIAGPTKPQHFHNMLMVVGYHFLVKVINCLKSELDIA